jgi:hypothetical protein
MPTLTKPMIDTLDPFVLVRHSTFTGLRPPLKAPLGVAPLNTRVEVPGF